MVAVFRNSLKAGLWRRASLWYEGGGMELGVDLTAAKRLRRRLLLLNPAEAGMLHVEFAA